MTARGLTLERLPGGYAVARLEPGAEVPPWAHAGAFTCFSRSHDELSIVCEEARVPPEVRAQRGFLCLRVDGPLDFAEVGVLASLADPLAERGISIFAVSTYDTDYLFLPAQRQEAALQALTEAGHTVRGGKEESTDATT